jgi:hypothetical protein
MKCELSQKDACLLECYDEIDDLNNKLSIELEKFKKLKNEYQNQLTFSNNVY